MTPPVSLPSLLRAALCFLVALTMGLPATAQTIHRTRATVTTSGQTRTVDFLHPVPGDPPPAVGAPTPWAFILLPPGLQPFGVSENGIVGFQSDDHRIYRWKAGVLEELVNPQGPDFPVLAVINQNGWIAVQYSHGEEIAPNVQIRDEYILVWPDSSITPYRVRGDQYVVNDYWDGDPFYTEGNQLRTTRLQYLDALNRVWAELSWNVVPGKVIAPGLRKSDIIWSELFRVDPASGARIMIGTGKTGAATMTVRGVNCQGTAIGDAPEYKGFIGDQTVDFTPLYINSNGLVLGSYYGIVASFVWYPDGHTEPLPTDGQVTWIDDQNRCNGFDRYVWETDAQPVLWVKKTGSDGLPLDPIRYERFAYLGLRLPEGWTTDHMVPPDAQSPQLGIAVRTEGGQVETQPFLAVPAALVVDANHDGRIAADDLPYPGSPDPRPFEFWINDDADSGDVRTRATDDVPRADGDASRNSANDRVDGLCDLADFFPVFLDLRQLLKVLPPATYGIAYFLRHDDEALGVVFTDKTRLQAFDHLRGDPSNLGTGFGPTLAQHGDEAMVTRLTAAGVDASAAAPAFFARMQNGDAGVLLVEAGRSTVKPLRLEVRRGAEVLAAVSLAIKTDPVETMFRYQNLRSYANGTAIAPDNQGPNYGISAPGDAPNDPFPDAPNRKNVVVVHGYNVNARQARGFAAEMFKRLYWAGSKARLFAVLWRGDDGQGEGVAPDTATPDYHRNVGHAWQQGPYLRDFLLGLPGATAIIAHSLGNMVTEVALTYERDPGNPLRLRPGARPAGVKSYSAIDAAVPLEAVDGTSSLAAGKALMRHPAWDGYHERLWPTHWHELFAGTTDARGRLTWQDVFAGLDIGTNFYSSGEEVLANPEDDGIPIWDPLFFGGLHAWVAQEKMKGGNSVAAGFLRSSTGGWGFNRAWYYDPTPALSPGDFGYVAPRPRLPLEAGETNVPTSGLSAEPFFRRFQDSESDGFYPGYQGSRLRAPVGDADADDEARKLVTLAKCLGEGIPALSFAQGRNASTAFDDENMGGNLNLNTAYDPRSGAGFRNGWPASRKDVDWKHSDCLDVAYLFNFPLYDRIIRDGGLK